MAYAIMRMTKLKSKREIGGALRHNTREKTPKNADPTKKDLNVSIGGNMAECMARVESLLPEKIRTNAVMGIEFVFTASPEFTGDWSKYLMDCSDWGLKTFGINPKKTDISPAINVALHRDEETPHIHMIVMPLKNGKLNAQHFIGGHRDRLSELQTDFWEKVGKPHELERGRPKAETRAKHTHYNLSGLAEKNLETKKSLEIKNQSISDKEKSLEAREIAVNNILKDLPNSQKIAVMITENLHGSTQTERQKFWPLFSKEIPAFTNSLLRQVKQDLTAEKAALTHNQRGQNAKKTFRSR
jgi:hypothetical protein